ncbi:MAG: DUF3187 family protein [bacterium]
MSGGGRARRALLTWTLLSALLSAWPAVADEFLFQPPVPTRNFAPLQLLFLNPAFEQAATLPGGEWALLIQTAESSVIATSQGRIDGTLKFEQNRTDFGVRYSVAEGWELGLNLPFISRYGGFLDPAIDWVERAFGAENPERSLFKDNTFGGYVVAQNDEVFLNAGRATFEPGDLVLSVKHAFDLPDAWPRLALRGLIKAPTGDPDKALGSGEPDFGAGIAADYSPCSRLMLYGNFNLVYPVGPITSASLTLNPLVTESFAAHLAISHRWTAMLHQATYTSPFHTGSKLLDGTVVELGLGVGFAWDERFGSQLLAIQNMSGVEQSADFTILLAVQWTPWAEPRGLPEVGPPLPRVSGPTSDASAPLPPLSPPPP